MRMIRLRNLELEQKSLVVKIQLIIFGQKHLFGEHSLSEVVISQSERLSRKMLGGFEWAGVHFVY